MGALLAAVLVGCVDSKDPEITDDTGGGVDTAAGGVDNDCEATASGTPTAGWTPASSRRATWTMTGTATTATPG
jgi:hypothetical protein